MSEDGCAHLSALIVLPMTAPRRQLFCFPPPLAAREKWPKSDFGRKLAGHLTGRKRGDVYSACKRSPSRAYAVTRPSTLPFKEPTNAKVIPGGCVIFALGDTFAQPRKRIIARPRSVAARTPLLCLLFFFFSRERAATLHPPPLFLFSLFGLPHLLPSPLLLLECHPCPLVVLLNIDGTV